MFFPDKSLLVVIGTGAMQKVERKRICLQALLALETVDILKWVQQSPKSSLFCLRIPKGDWPKSLIEELATEAPVLPWMGHHPCAPWPG